MPDIPTTTPPPAATQTPPAPDAKPTPKEPAKETLEGIKQFAARHLPGRFEAPKKETAEEKTAREAAEAKAAGDKKKKETPAPKRKPRPQPQLTADQIAEAAARGVATAIQPKQDTQPPKPDKADDGLDPEEREQVSVLRDMEKLFPDKYSGIAQAYLDGQEAYQEYVQKWEQAHPGEEFNEDDEEHRPFFDRNDVDWDDMDYAKAVAKREVDTALEAERRKMNEKLSVFERKEKLREAAPQIAQAQVQPARLFWSQFGEDHADVIGQNGSPNLEKVVALQKSDPVGFAIRVQAGNDLATEVAELYKVMNGLEDYDPKNPVHVNVGQFAAEQERALAAKEADERLDAKGRDFLPADRYYKLPKEQRDQYWTFGAQDIAALRAAHLAGLAKNLIAAREQELEQWAASKGFAKGTTTPKPQPEAKVDDEPAPEPADGKPSGPGGGVESRMTANRRASGGGTPNFDSVFLDRQLGRK